MSKRNRNRNRTKARAEIEARIQEKELKKSFWEEREEDWLNEKEVEEEQELEEELEIEDMEIDHSQQNWYVLDTNLILSCVNVLPDVKDKHWREPLNFEPDLSNACLIIPETVKEELNHFKGSRTFNGIAARTALKRLANLLPNSGRSLNDIMHLNNPIPTGVGSQTVAVLPLHRNFTKCLPWVPEADDNDGLIATTALAAKMIRHEMPIDGTANMEDVLQLRSGGDEVVLLTRDNDLLEKADRFATSAVKYSFSLRRPYEGCRELTVPAAMFEQFFNEECLSQETFEDFLPDELPLVDNEYIIMYPENDQYPRSYFVSARPFMNIARYHKGNGMLYPLRYMKYEGITPPNARIATSYDAFNDDKIKVIIADGEAGTGKTFQAVRHAIREVKAGRKVKIVIIPTKRSKSDLGALPGNKEAKMEPLVGICKSAIAADLEKTPEFIRKREELRMYGEESRKKKGHSECDDSNYDEHSYKKGKYKGSEYSCDAEADDYPVGGFEKTRKSSKKGKSKTYSTSSGEDLMPGKITSMSYYELLKKEVDYIFDRYFVCCPREEVDGKTFHNAFIIVDEIQRIHDLDELLTILTRAAEDSKLFLAGDTEQIRDKTDEKILNNGVTYARARFFDLPEVACIHFTENMRGGASALETEDYVEAYARIMGY